MVTLREPAQASVRCPADGVPCTHNVRPPGFRDCVRMGRGRGHVGVLGELIFLAEPRQVLAWWPLPTINRVASPEQPVVAACINLALVVVFGLQHSMMARPWFKRCVMGWVADGLERATYVPRVVSAVSGVGTLPDPFRAFPDASCAVALAGCLESL